MTPSRTNHVRVHPGGGARYVEMTGEDDDGARRGFVTSTPEPSRGRPVIQNTDKQKNSLNTNITLLATEKASSDVKTSEDAPPPHDVSHKGQELPDTSITPEEDDIVDPPSQRPSVRSESGTRTMSILSIALPPPNPSDVLPSKRSE